MYLVLLSDTLQFHLDLLVGELDDHARSSRAVGEVLVVDLVDLAKVVTVRDKQQNLQHLVQTGVGSLQGLLQVLNGEDSLLLDLTGEGTVLVVTDIAGGEDLAIGLVSRRENLVFLAADVFPGNLLHCE